MQTDFLKGSFQRHSAHTRHLEVALIFFFFFLMQGICIASEKSSSFYKAGESKLLSSEVCFAWMIVLVPSELWGLEGEQKNLIFFIDMHKFRHMQSRIGRISSVTVSQFDNKIYVPSCQSIKYTACGKILLPGTVKADVEEVTWSKEEDSQFSELIYSVLMHSIPGILIIQAWFYCIFSSS